MNASEKPTTIAYWIALALTALAVRIVVAFVVFGTIGQKSDALAYANQAREMVSGSTRVHSYPWPPGRSFALVPFFLVFGTSEPIVRANAVVFDVGCVLMAAVLAHQVLRRRSAARLTGWIAAFYPPTVMLSAWSYAENVALFALLGAACIALAAIRTSAQNGWWSLGSWFLSGCLLGLMILTRPSAFSILGMVMVGWIGFLAVRRFRPDLVGAAAHVSWGGLLGTGLAFLLGVVGSIAPVIEHHACLGVGWVVSTNSEVNFFLGNNPYTPHYKSWHLGQRRTKETGIPEYEAYVAPLVNRPDARSALMHEALRYIWERPDIFVLRTMNRLRTFWGFDYPASGRVMEDWPWCGAWGVLCSLAVEAGGYCLTMFWVICGFFLFPRAMATKHALFLIAVVVAYQLPYMIAFGSGSYHGAVIAFLFPFAGLSLDEARREGTAFWSTIKGRKWFWIAVGFFILVQLEYAYFVFAYHGSLRH